MERLLRGFEPGPVEVKRRIRRLGPLGHRDLMLQSHKIQSQEVLCTSTPRMYPLFQVTSSLTVVSLLKFAFFPFSILRCFKTQNS